MDIIIYKYIISISELGGITKAAEMENISQPALSRHLKNVEKDLGAVIFSRNKTGLKLTDAGKIFVHNAYAIYNEYLQMQKDIDKIPLGISETIIIASDKPSRRFISQKVIDEFKRMHERIDLIIVEIENDETEPYLLSGKAQIVLTLEPSIKKTEFETIILNQEELVLVTRNSIQTPNWPLKNSSQIPYDSIHDNPLVVLDDKNIYSGIESKIVNSLKLKPSLNCSVNTYIEKLSLIQKSTGSGIFTKSFLSSYAPDMLGIQIFPIPSEHKFIHLLRYAKYATKPMKALSSIIAEAATSERSMG